MKNLFVFVSILTVSFIAFRAARFATRLQLGVALALLLGLCLALIYYLTSATLLR